MKIRSLVFLFFLASLPGCVSTRAWHATPKELMEQATVSGMQNIRAFNDRPSTSYINDFVQLLEQKEKKGFDLFNVLTDTPYTVLAISGGAASGAYGAGLLNGWSQSGSRPVFNIVTGISTGAIIAPFAFLGSEFDGVLKEIYTKHSTKDILRKKSIWQMLCGDSFMNNYPLEHLITQYFDKALLKKISNEYGKGRRLYVGTTDLDAQELVIWDMGKIASVGDDHAVRLFRKIIIASASIPVIFPPVYFEVEVNGKRYEEMHVDGGITKQVFFLYDVLHGLEKAAQEKGIKVSNIKYSIYVIRNGYAEPIWREVPNKIVSIAERTVYTLVNAQGLGDIYQLYAFTQKRGGDFNLSYIPATHVPNSKELIDPIEMRKLFDLGIQQALQGKAWKKVPPGLGSVSKVN